MFSKDHLTRLVSLCKARDAWLVVDQTYYEFLFDGAAHTFPCRKALGYDKIVHLFSFSKSFGMPGWRVGYLVIPKALRESMRKVVKWINRDCVHFLSLQHMPVYLC